MRQLVIGTGLPRTGTTSLAEALKVLGYDVIHHCPFTSPHCEMRKDPIGTAVRHLTESGPKAIVSSEFLKHMQLFQGMPVIYLHREREQVASSLARLGYPDFNLAEYEHSVPRGSYFVDTTDLSWEVLCPYLGADMPATPFPWVNRTQQL